jgi:hypothetical protein
MHRESILPENIRDLRRWNYVRIYHGLQFGSLNLIQLAVHILDAARLRRRSFQAFTQRIEIGHQVRHRRLLLASILRLTP